MELLYSGLNITFFKELRDGNFLIVQYNYLKIIERDTKAELMVWKTAGNAFKDAIQLSDGNLLVSSNAETIILNPQKKNRVSTFAKRRCNLQQIKGDLVLIDLKCLYDFSKNEIVYEQEQMFTVVYLKDVDRILLSLDNGYRFLDEDKITNYRFYNVEYLCGYKVVYPTKEGLCVYDLEKKKEIKRIEGEENFRGCVDGMIITFNSSNYRYNLYDSNADLVLSKDLGGYMYNIIGDEIIIRHGLDYYVSDIWLNYENLVRSGGSSHCPLNKRDCFIVGDRFQYYVYKNKYEFPPK